ncbi:MAG TPA: proline dehydrogenase family protein [Candidatus Eisenbacteria bacterium]|jgi:proline dehydrogenase
MNLLRSALIAGSQNAWLRKQASRRRSLRRAVSRFMPGETLDDALRAAGALRDLGMGAILTHLGENVRGRAEAEAVTRHYFEVIERVRAMELDAEISVKLTQLGLDVSPDLAHDNLARVASCAQPLGNRVWIDMESSAYTDTTLVALRHVRGSRANVGVCLQSYLRRTASDLEALLPLGVPIRLVKGAYDEPPRLAFRSKRQVDESFMALAARLLSDEARRAGVWFAAATHDPKLIRRVEALAASQGVAKTAYEFAMLYGVQRAEQLRLARAGCRLRVLISYGAYWFPWYMRRLAERPANVLFAVRSLLRA